MIRTPLEIILIIFTPPLESKKKKKSKKNPDMALEHPTLFTSKKEKVIENHNKQSNPLINGLSGFD